MRCSQLQVATVVPGGAMAMRTMRAPDHATGRASCGGPPVRACGRDARVPGTSGFPPPLPRNLPRQAVSRGTCLHGNDQGGRDARVPPGHAVPRNGDSDHIPETTASSEAVALSAGGTPVSPRDTPFSGDRLHGTRSRSADESSSSCRRFHGQGFTCLPRRGVLHGPRRSPGRSPPGIGYAAHCRDRPPPSRPAAARCPTWSSPGR